MSRISKVLSFCSGVIISSLMMLSVATASESSLQDLPKMKNWFYSAGDWTQDSHLFVTEVGRGAKTVVALHGGWGAEHSGMVDMIRGLEDDYRFVFYEQRGSLRSAAPDETISYEQHINDLEVLRTQLELEKLILMGHSMGSVLASAYAQRYPRNIEQLILISPAYLKQPIPQQDKSTHHEVYVRSQAFKTDLRRDTELRRYGLDQPDKTLNHKQLTAKSRINFASLMLFDIEKWPQLTNGKSLYKGRVYELTQKSYPVEGWDFWTEFSKGVYPVTIISGSHDQFDFDGLLLKQWQKEVPEVSLIMLQNAGHLPWIDQPEKTKSEINKALSRKLE